MLINLKTCAVQDNVQTVKLELDSRLPMQVISPCTAICQFSVTKDNSYYLLTLHVKAMLNIICQRCLDEFNHPYVNQTELAICHSDERAEQLLGQFETIVAVDDRVDLAEVLIDELHLYAPQCHSSLQECNSETSQFILNERE